MVKNINKIGKAKRGKWRKQTFMRRQSMNKKSAESMRFLTS
jgi:hypothetical protein